MVEFYLFIIYFWNDLWCDTMRSTNVRFKSEMAEKEGNYGRRWRVQNFINHNGDINMFAFLFYFIIFWTIKELF